MKKLGLFLVLAGLSMSAMADTDSALKITKTDGSTQSLEISSIRSIKFDGSSMVVNKTDDSTETLNISDIDSMSFSSIESAIKLIAGNNTNGKMMITDLAGRVVYRGNVESLNQLELHGIYVITVDGVSHKVSIK